MDQWEPIIIAKASVHVEIGNNFFDHTVQQIQRIEFRKLTDDDQCCSNVWQEKDQIEG